jgi:hypothetical protein
MRAVHEIPQRVGMDPGQPDENARVVDVVILQVIRRGILLEQRVALREVHPHGQRVRLRRLVHRLTDEHLPADFKREPAVHADVLDVGERQANRADGVETGSLHRRDCKTNRIGRSLCPVA